MLEATAWVFGFQPRSTLIEFALQDGPFLRTPVTFTLSALIRLNQLCPTSGMATDDFLTLEFDSQFHDRILVAQE
jgi:hypothetical protein